MLAEHLVLQKLQHARRESFGHAVYLVKEKYSLGLAGIAHEVVHRADDLAHCVLGHLIAFSAVFLFRDIRQTERALARVMGHGIRHESHAKFGRYLLHDSRFAYARRAYHKYRALLFYRYAVAAELVL